MSPLYRLNDQTHINILDHIQSSSKQESLGISHYIPTSCTKATYEEPPERYSLVIAKRKSGKMVRRLMIGDYTAIWVRGNKKAIRGKISEISQGSVWVEDREIAISALYCCLYRIRPAAIHSIKPTSHAHFPTVVNCK